jgi:hypothetical protein
MIGERMMKPSIAVWCWNRLRITEKDPFTVIDIDVKEGEQPTAEQQAIFTEFRQLRRNKPKRRGLHNIVRGKVPQTRGKKASRSIHLLTISS